MYALNLVAKLKNSDIIYKLGEKYMKFISKSEKETFKIADAFAKVLNGGEVVVLNGDLGAGKTTFTKGLAHALNITENVTSPTFTLMNIYSSGRLKLYHFDMYRLEDESEALELGLGEFFGNKDSVCMIEWAENIRSLLPKKLITINITKLGDNTREFEFLGVEK